MVDLNKYGSWALVTGASSGLGLAYARLLASRGMNCVLVGLDEARLAELSDELSKQHAVECRHLELNLASDGFLPQLEQVTADIPVGMLINNAGIGCGGAVATRDPGRLEELVRLNCLAPVVLTRAYLPAMLERGAGAIVFVSSLQGFISSPFESAYCASKAFGLHFGESLWGELRHTPIDVITVCPAGMKTDFFKAEGFSREDCDRMWRVSSSPESIAKLTFRKLGKKPVTAPGVTLLVSLLARLLPRRWVMAISDRITQRLVNMERS